jgi:Magnesium chelatase, subunit ChlI
VLLLDELAEFPRSVLEALRQPLEDGLVSVSRVGGHALFPARFQVAGTINLCIRRPFRLDPRRGGGHGLTPHHRAREGAPPGLLFAGPWPDVRLRPGALASFTTLRE